MIEQGEIYAQELKKCARTGQIDQVMSEAIEKLDEMQGPQNLRRFIKMQIESVGSLRKEVILQAALINSLEANNK